ncbi:DUF1501 domain-containing protein [Pseudoxanthomonas sp. CF125]|uniref:DUF1501 domain-containing protein n=1 Tax=Pseudoxanthomonas sp. CF125 TaxID=1855303 RepID=UPI00088583F5|nr:DUF1501 domain-containing protein [Pseudoxanthomonas sp. CF125]SDQ46572.1 Uncharacterized conserved protein, DUF1501 family [Pseudoxanthomonas sp. CF125]
MSLTRRGFIGAAGALTSLTLWPNLGIAAANDTRMLVVLLRGGVDGLHVVVPRNDPAYARLRGSLVPADARAVDADFSLHPSLSFAHELYGRKQLLPVVAIAPPYRQRSHFEAQDCLENGTARPGGISTGWLNRCVSAMAGSEALSLTTVMPLIMRGPGDATTWSPPLPEEVNPVLLQRLQTLYAADPKLAGSFARAVESQDMEMSGGKGGRLPQALASAAAFMAKTDGPRIAFVEDSGWDTHSNQAAVLTRKLKELDAGLRAFHDGMTPFWSRTVVVVLSEFGRTAAANGTGGTDHGTGGIALLAGGAVKGGRIAGDWPGLAQGALNEGRDLRATSDTRALLKGVLASHLRVPESALETKVFPDSRDVRAIEGLLL